jgi:hypothetical protein
MTQSCAGGTVRVGSVFLDHVVDHDASRRGLQQGVMHVVLLQLVMEYHGARHRLQQRVMVVRAARAAAAQEDGKEQREGDN